MSVHSQIYTILSQYKYCDAQSALTETQSECCILARRECSIGWVYRDVQWRSIPLSKQSKGSTLNQTLNMTHATQLENWKYAWSVSMCILDIQYLSWCFSGRCLHSFASKSGKKTPHALKFHTLPNGTLPALTVALNGRCTRPPMFGTHEFQAFWCLLHLLHLLHLLRFYKCFTNVNNASVIIFGCTEIWLLPM